MSATQISFASFAIAQQAAAAVVALSLMADDCESSCSDYSEFRRLVELANETEECHSGQWSRGGYVLAALANARAPLYSGRSDQADLMRSLRFLAQCCIGAGC